MISREGYLSLDFLSKRFLAKPRGDSTGSINNFQYSLLGGAHSSTLPLMWNLVGTLLTTYIFLVLNRSPWEEKLQQIGSDIILNFFRSKLVVLVEAA